MLDKYESPADGYVSLLKLPELREVRRPEARTAGRWAAGAGAGAVFGAAVTLSELISELEKLAATAGYRHCAEMARHLRVVANTPVRNAATWAGNLMIKYKHRAFPSDVFLLLTAARATLKIGQCTVCRQRSLLIAVGFLQSGVGGSVTCVRDEMLASLSECRRELAPPE